jgi:Domain of unknown function (DUF3576)
MRIKSLGVLFVLALALAGCGSSSQTQQAQLPPVEPTKHPEDPYHPHDETTTPQQSVNLMGMLFGSGSKEGGAAGGPSTGVGVNSYLWRATLDTVSFMPLASADPFGGVIITDWYSPADSQVERFKLNVLILGRELRADAVRCTVFRQKRDPGGQWADAPVDVKTGVDLENAILTRARQMRLSTAAVTK